MSKSELEAWALSIIDRVIAGQPVEDDRVELKAQWIDSKKAAKRIAGHANASHGEPALWLIGVDENGPVPGVEMDKYTDWYQAVRSCFDELAPEIVRINVPYGDVMVVALLIETDRAPFVVKCQEGGGVSREVPYRHGTRCDSATRGQLLRVLTPVANSPSVEVASCRVDAAKSNAGGKWNQRWEFSARLFVTQPQDQQTVFAAHKSSSDVQVAAENVTIRPLRFSREYSDSDAESVSVIGPGYFLVRGVRSFYSEAEPFFSADQIEFHFAAAVPNVPVPTEVRHILPLVTTSGPQYSAWEVNHLGEVESTYAFVEIG